MEAQAEPDPSFHHLPFPEWNSGKDSHLPSQEGDTQTPPPPH